MAILPPSRVIVKLSVSSRIRGSALLLHPVKMSSINIIIIIIFFIIITSSKFYVALHVADYLKMCNSVNPRK